MSHEGTKDTKRKECNGSSLFHVGKLKSSLPAIR